VVPDVSTALPDQPPEPPPHLEPPERQIWNDVVAEWSGSKASFAVLTSGLEAHMRARQCAAIIDEEGMVTLGRDGQPRVHPLCQVERANRKAFEQVFRQLGIKL
jgi:P27 family predicted phage terminase small subunit